MKEIKLTPSEQLNSEDGYQNKQNSNSKLFDVIEVPGTLFSLLLKDEEYRILFGNEIVSPKIFRNEKTAIDYIKSKPWELIFICTGIFYDKMKANLKLLEDAQTNSSQNP